MRENQKLINVFNDALGSGIFASLQSLDVPWKNDNIAQELDLAFITNYGARNISPLVKACLDENGKLTTAKQNLIASTLYHLNNPNWLNQYNTLFFEYNPIENYSMVETHSGSDTTTDTPDNWKESETQTPTNWKQTETQTPTNWTETETQTPTNWTETETQTPTNWTETETQTPTNWTETETQTPTNWKETKTESVGEDGYKEIETQTPDEWKETTSGLQADNIADASNQIYAFNSSEPVDVSKSQSKVSSKSEVEKTGTYETSKEITGEKITDTEQTGTFETERTRTGTFETERTKTGTFETEKTRTGTFETERTQTGTFATETATTGTFKTDRERTGTYEKETVYDTELTRSGNIGVTTSQQMITSERELWLWHYFQEVVFKDICKALTLSIY